MFWEILLTVLFHSIDDNVQNIILLDMREGNTSHIGKKLLNKLISFPTFRNVLFFRIKDINSSRIQILLKLLLHKFRLVNTVEINSAEGIGGGLYLPHQYCIINAQSIGNHVSILQGVTIGKDLKGKRPRIGDNVIICPNAVVVGDITIGSNSIIGAGCVVKENIPNNSTVKSADPIVCAYRK